MVSPNQIVGNNLGQLWLTPTPSYCQEWHIEGKYVASLNQDLFLGVPFAQPPLGGLRFQNPQSVNDVFEDVRDAKEYANSCLGHGNCLTLSIVRPSGRQDGANLPARVFIHGGVYLTDYSGNAVNNLSFIAKESARMDKPIMAVSLDYRLSAWSFLASQEAVDAGIANTGLEDQRIGLQWINESIAAIGGDLDKATNFDERSRGR
ncbi:hypothetical protein jhhlp_008234 [Lomentospora prolificans]|uniref:Carboxylesterase type B domain-containing protein n=1 Tax=Lomentospora prolificans TaxID=41688 RepID=A0A2N3MXG8_9PEZI|nr:hypothetical protein jhhlp_008234 [Lomentospora prolificans]